MIETVNPATGELLAAYPTHSPAEIEALLGAAGSAQESWRDLPLAARTDLLRGLGSVLVERREQYAALITAEMGKPLAEALAEVDKCALVCRFYADSAVGFLADEPIETDADAVSLVRYEPLGVVLAIMPWNFPFWQVMRFAAPTVAAGNAALLKHSPNVTGCALALGSLFVDAGFPPGLFGVLLLAEPSVADTVGSLIEDPRIAAVTLTGSERAGASVGAAAGRALKKAVLELGGSDPFVVLADADVPAAVDGAVRSRFANAGQSCVCAKRFIVAESVADEFEQAFVAAVAALPVGDPTAAGIRIGPMARADLVDDLARQVDESVARGARILTGGGRVAGAGNHYAPTVLVDVVPEMSVFAEETFGPVAVVVRAADDDEAIALANQTRYGLGASVWSKDTAHALAVGRRIRSGALFVNGIVASDPRLPFGGVGRSGYGRELGAAGIREFTNVRTVWARAFE